MTCRRKSAPRLRKFRPLTRSAHWRRWNATTLPPRCVRQGATAPRPRKDWALAPQRCTGNSSANGTESGAVGQRRSLSGRRQQGEHLFIDLLRDGGGLRILIGCQETGLARRRRREEDLLKDAWLVSN